ncbi:uncharacterized protein si:ch211-250c4.3 isoform X1 [Hypomesus transpacificus]|uniref:uncharacterized protein si:ch211-250c4.3 isoform X1 n=2 Tax=Hypomesus transpacificus TaxID=137520 RepID=UPI001F071A55|nr:uncharacterized protein si:ch211-250c4.3 isoform X1 [Hypomesus transpacificus]XP_046884909.1 uncharacterized protein si:ch211-250c4.3 isoform X1 [Hypomesus transpacificus]
MSVKRKKASMVFSWQKSFSILTPWRKGKGDMVLESEVVLTKMKLFNNSHEKLLNGDDSASTISMSVSEQDISEHVKAMEGNSDLDNIPGSPLMESSSDYLSVIFSDTKLPRLYKFESEDSGVELPSGANSPSTPTGSEQSFVVHSREPSCDSCNLNNPVLTSDPLFSLDQRSESSETENSNDNSLCTTLDTREYTVVNPETELGSEIERPELHVTKEATDVERTQGEALGDTFEKKELTSEQLVENEAVTEEFNSENFRPRSPCFAGACDSMTGVETEQQPLRKSSTIDSLEEYMEECCRLSEVQKANSNPLGSGLGYLEHICQLIEKIGQLQETNLGLQKQICSLQKDNRMTKTKDDFFQQHCSCGAASLAFQDLKKLSRGEFLNSSNSTLSDLSTIPEVTRHPALTLRRDVGSEAGCQSLGSVPLWRRGLNRRSYTEGEARYLCDSSERLSAPHRRQSENYTWGRVKDLVKKSKLRNQSRLSLTSTSLKMSCPQLYRPDLGPVDLPGRNRNSMIALGHQNKMDMPWLQ